MPLQLGLRGLGEELHIFKMYVDVPPKWVDFTQKSVNMSLILTPPKNPQTMVKFVENRVKNYGEKFGKWVYSLSKR